MRFYTLLAIAGATAVAAAPAYGEKPKACHVKPPTSPQPSGVAPGPAPVPSSPSTPPPAGQDPSCKDVHTFLLKGWNEPYPGRQGALAAAICDGVASCDYEDIIMDNMAGSDFCAAVSQGTTNGINQMQAYAAKCPNSKLVLSGFSQGAYALTNILAGGGAPFSGGCTPANTPALDNTSGAGAQLAAIMTFGDVQHTGDQSYNVLNGAPYDSNDPVSGARLQRLNRYAGVLRSYCHIDDATCAARGPGPFTSDNIGHLNYFELYTQEAAGWVKSKLGL